ncbi:hypothetical protein [Allohahella marinimesophila]|uniref:hypothetical protein n=1 Tax=Allohahella marinimesophila TaxID=1054972 RepID=UPI0031D3E20A
MKRKSQAGFKKPNCPLQKRFSRSCTTTQSFLFQRQFLLLVVQPSSALTLSLFNKSATAIGKWRSRAMSKGRRVVAIGQHGRVLLA